MPVQLVRADALYMGAPYAYASIAPPGSLVFTAGACPLDPQGKVVHPGDIPGQTRQALSNLLRVLEASGASTSDVVKTTIYVVATSRADLVAAWREVEATFGTQGAPSTLLGVAFLGYPDQLVEIEAIAALS